VEREGAPMSRSIPKPPYEASNPTDAIATALSMLGVIAEEQRRQSEAMERIADRLDSWTSGDGASLDVSRCGGV
jgi:hypothetical protein